MAHAIHHPSMEVLSESDPMPQGFHGPCIAHHGRWQWVAITAKASGGFLGEARLSKFPTNFTSPFAPAQFSQLLPKEAMPPGPSDLKKG